MKRITSLLMNAALLAVMSVGIPMSAAAADCCKGTQCPRTAECCAKTDCCKDGKCTKTAECCKDGCKGACCKK